MGLVHLIVRAAIFVAASVPMSVLTSPAAAQVSPMHECALFKRPIELSVRVPDQAPSVLIELIDPSNGQVIETRPARPGNTGKVDLAEVFPKLWTTDSPKVVYAQATIGGADVTAGRIGSPVVLVPMVAPRYAPRIDREGTPQVNPPVASKTRVLSGYWTYTDQRVEITTSKGRLTFALRPDAAPNSVDNFRTLVSREFYDGIRIHRIASLSGRTLPDIIQFGDPTGTGQGGPGYFIDFEPSPLKHSYGTLSFARTTDPNSAGSQVLICLGRESAAQLDGKYTVFGRLVLGVETLEALSKSPTDADGRPRDPIAIESAKLVDAPPFGTGPKPEVDPLEKPSTR
jgi:peptidyl-prolyl cis-trans isomerase B (cyclophilin B)